MRTSTIPGSWAGLAAVPLCLILTGCSGDGPTPVDLSVASVSVSAPATTLEVGATLQLSATARAAAGDVLSGKQFTWSSSDNAIATVATSGAVVGVASGTVAVTATETGSSHSGSVNLTVVPAAVSSISITPSEASTVIGQAVQLTVQLRDSRGAVLSGRTVTWASADDGIVQVDAQGLAEGVALGGPVAVTASSEGVSGTAQVTVVPVPVHSVSISPEGPLQLTVGSTVDLDATARDADGNVLGDREISWSSSNPDVASVSAVGRVSGEAVGGPATITAEVEGVEGTVQVEVIEIPVASVTVEPSTVTMTQGGTHQLEAVIRDDEGNVLSGRSVVWTSSDEAVASVDGTGLVSALTAGGPVTITATSEGVSGSGEVIVEPRTAARVEVSPRFTVLDVNASSAFTVSAIDADGVEISDPVVTWTSGSASIATVSSVGSVEGASPGHTHVTAQVDAVLDTAWVAVLGPASLYSTAFSVGFTTEASAGQTVSVPVVLDLSRVASEGDLGSVQFDLTYDADVLTYDSAEVGVEGSASYHVPSPGVFKFSFAGTGVQDGTELTLVTITFHVASSASVGVERAFGLEYTTVPTSTDFAAYSIPVAIGGRIRVVAQ